MHWWTLSQRIRTYAEVPISAALLEAEKPPLFQQNANRALHLNLLGFSTKAIAPHLGVDGKTVAKTLRLVVNL
jgi:hypothetical protein